MMQTEFRTATVLAADDLAGMNEDRSRRIGKLPERILVAAHQACDLGALDIAAQLLSSLEAAISRKGKGPFDPAHRRLMESLIAVHHRLWYLRHSGEHAAAAPGA